MDDIFRELDERGVVVVYMDDILIFAKTREDLERYTKEVLQILKENDLYLKPEKCEFSKTEIDYLGFIISEGQIRMDPSKVKGIADWTPPKTKKELQSFLGFVNFYRRFNKNHADICRPLYDKLKKDQTFIPVEQDLPALQAFRTLKTRFCEEPILRMPDTSRPFQIEADASKYASGAVLTQMDENGNRHPVAYLSQSFNPAERNYEIYDRELLAIYRALDEWRHYLQGSPHTITVLSDHKNLTYFRKAQKLNRRQARWSLFLSEFDLQLVHVPGTKMVVADALSRRPDLCPEEDHDNEDIVMLPDNLFVNLIDIDLQERVITSDSYDADAANALKLLLEDGPSELKSDLDDWTVEFSEDNKPVLFRRGKMYIPQNEELRRHIVHSFHDPITAGHPGELETFNAVRQHYWWPGMRSFVKKYVNGCGACQQFKINRQPSKPALISISGPKSHRPFAQTSVDFITDLPPVNGYDSIMVVVDHGLTKGVILTPCKKSITAAETASLLLDHLYKRFGLPDKLISDRGPQFAAQVFQELTKLLGIKSTLTTAYHPQSDGSTERTNQEIEAYLSIFCSSQPDEWLKLLPTLEFTHNNRRHADRTQTPFELMFGTAPIAIPLTFEHSNIPAVEARLEELSRTRNEALAAHELARQRINDRIKANFKPFQKGDKVWLEAKNLRRNVPKKISAKREGPFTITEVLGPVTYRLQLPKTWKIHNVFHATLLSPYRTTPVYGENFPQPPPDVIDGDDFYEVDRIVSHRKRGRGHQYLIRWKGYTAEDDSWQKLDDLKNSEEILNEYQRRKGLPITTFET